MTDYLENETRHLISMVVALSDNKIVCLRQRQDKSVCRARRACYRIRLPLIGCDRDCDEEASRIIRHSCSMLWLIALALLLACHSSGERAGAPVVDANRNAAVINATTK